MWFVCRKRTRLAPKVLTKHCRGGCARRSVTFSLPSWPSFSAPPASPAVLLCPRPSLGLWSKDWSPFWRSYSPGTGLQPCTTEYRLTVCRGSHVPVLLHRFFFPFSPNHIESRWAMTEWNASRGMYSGTRVSSPPLAASFFFQSNLRPTHRTYLSLHSFVWRDVQWAALATRRHWCRVNFRPAASGDAEICEIKRQLSIEMMLRMCILDLQ